MRQYEYTFIVLLVSFIIQTFKVFKLNESIDFLQSTCTYFVTSARLMIISIKRIYDK